MTQSAVDRLSIGMTIEEVTRTIGIEGWDHVPGFSHGPVTPTDPAVSAQYSADTDESRWTIRAWPEQYFGPASAHVIFRDGRAVEITTS